MRLHTENKHIKAHQLDGMTGLELESHRIDQNGCLAQTPHPFHGNPYIGRDFSEDQIEINTPPAASTGESLRFLHDQLAMVHRQLEDQGEMLWPFSNPPVICGKDAIPIARFTGAQSKSYDYRVYLSHRYGKYKMTYSGIHFNYSFSDQLLRSNFDVERVSGEYEGNDFRQYKDIFYLKLAEKVLASSWVVVALMAASPVVDNSFFEHGKSGESLFTGFSTLRCGELGYWNFFLPILSYDSVKDYADWIRSYVERGLLKQERELYFPVRIKPAGVYTLDALEQGGVNHIELRQVDLNPFSDDGITEEDIDFLKLYLIWLASLDMEPLTHEDQMQSLQNHKNAAGYDWDIAQITMREEKTCSLREGLVRVLNAMDRFFAPDERAQAVIQYQRLKTEGESVRYAGRVRHEYGRDYIGKGLKRAREIQDSFLNS